MADQQVLDELNRFRNFRLPNWADRRVMVNPDEYIDDFTINRNLTRLLDNDRFLWFKTDDLTVAVSAYISNYQSYSAFFAEASGLSAGWTATSQWAVNTTGLLVKVDADTSSSSGGIPTWTNQDNYVENIYSITQQSLTGDGSDSRFLVPTSHAIKNYIDRSINHNWVSQFGGVQQNHLAVWNYDKEIKSSRLSETEFSPLTLMSFKNLFIRQSNFGDGGLTNGARRNIQQNSDHLSMFHKLYSDYYGDEFKYNNLNDIVDGDGESNYAMTWSNSIGVLCGAFDEENYYVAGNDGENVGVLFPLSSYVAYTAPGDRMLTHSERSALSDDPPFKANLDYVASDSLRTFGDLEPGIWDVPKNAYGWPTGGGIIHIWPRLTRFGLQAYFDRRLLYRVGEEVTIKLNNGNGYFGVQLKVYVKYVHTDGFTDAYSTWDKIYYVDKQLKIPVSYSDYYPDRGDVTPPGDIVYPSFRIEVINNSGLNLGIYDVDYTYDFGSGVVELNQSYNWNGTPVNTYTYSGATLVQSTALDCYVYKRVRVDNGQSDTDITPLDISYIFNVDVDQTGTITFASNDYSKGKIGLYEKTVNDPTQEGTFPVTLLGAETAIVFGRTAQNPIKEGMTNDVKAEGTWEGEDYYFKAVPESGHTFTGFTFENLNNVDWSHIPFHGYGESDNSNKYSYPNKFNIMSGNAGKVTASFARLFNVTIYVNYPANAAGIFRVTYSDGTTIDYGYLQPDTGISYQYYEGTEPFSTNTTKVITKIEAFTSNDATQFDGFTYTLAGTTNTSSSLANLGSSLQNNETIFATFSLKAFTTTIVVQNGGVAVQAGGLAYVTSWYDQGANLANQFQIPLAYNSSLVHGTYWGALTPAAGYDISTASWNPAFANPHTVTSNNTFTLSMGENSSVTILVNCVNGEFTGLTALGLASRVNESNSNLSITKRVGEVINHTDYWASALEDTGYEGGSWSPSFATPYTFSTNQTFNFVYTIKSYTVTITVPANASASSFQGKGNPGTFNYGDDASYSINADSGYYISSYTVDSVLQWNNADENRTSWPVSFLSISSNHTVSFTVTAKSGAVPFPDNTLFAFVVAGGDTTGNPTNSNSDDIVEYNSSGRYVTIDLSSGTSVPREKGCIIFVGEDKFADTKDATSFETVKGALYKSVEDLGGGNYKFTFEDSYPITHIDAISPAAGTHSVFYSTTDGSDEIASSIMYSATKLAWDSVQNSVTTNRVALLISSSNFLNDDNVAWGGVTIASSTDAYNLVEWWWRRHAKASSNSPLTTRTAQIIKGLDTYLDSGNSNNFRTELLNWSNYVKIILCGKHALATTARFDGVVTKLATVRSGKSAGNINFDSNYYDLDSFLFVNVQRNEEVNITGDNDIQEDANSLMNLTNGTSITGGNTYATVDLRSTNSSLETIFASNVFIIFNVTDPANIMYKKATYASKPDSTTYRFNIDAAQQTFANSVSTSTTVIVSNYDPSNKKYHNFYSVRSGDIDSNFFLYK